jgi:hypothetical protein
VVDVSVPLLPLEGVAAGSVAATAGATSTLPPQPRIEANTRLSTYVLKSFIECDLKVSCAGHAAVMLAAYRSPLRGMSIRALTIYETERRAR